MSIYFGKRVPTSGAVPDGWTPNDSNEKRDKRYHDDSLVTPKQSAPREWWIFEKSPFEHIAKSEPGPGRFHVIEHSAYADLKLDHSALKSLLAKKDLELDQCVRERDEARDEAKRCNDRTGELLLWKQRMDDAYNKKAKLNFDLEALLDECEQALSTWVAYEEEQIAKEGPYVSLNIPHFIAQAKAVLNKLKSRKG